jgi:hypothetical protein
MKTWSYLFLFVAAVTNAGCFSNPKENDYYEFLAICMGEFFLDHGVNATEKLEDFEFDLIEEGHLYDNSGKAYKVLLRNLSRDIYFAPPLKIDDFHNTLLYKNPPELYRCVNFHYGVDSLALTQLKFFTIQEKIGEELSSKKEVRIQDLFAIYLNNLDNSDFEKPYIKETILLLLYRWYFASKYNREIPVNFDELPVIDQL